VKIAGREIRVWKKPVAKDEKSSPPVDPDTQLQARWTNGANLKTRAITYGLFAALVAGPVALALVVGQVSSAAPPIATQAVLPVDTSGEQAAVGEFAQQFVLAWLQTPRGKESALAAFVATANLQLPNKAVTASQPSTAQLVHAGPGVWSVSVGVTVTDAGGVVRRYFQVPVRYVAGAMIATSLPAPMPAPGTATSPELAYQYTAALSDPSAAMVGQFLAALLAGSGDVTRYVSPGTAIAAVTPAPYTAVRVLEVRTDQDLRDAPMAVPRGSDLRVLVTAVATVSAEQQVTVQYPLTLRVRASRWEVASVDPVPRTNTDPRPSLIGTTAPTSPSTSSAPSVSSPPSSAPAAPPAATGAPAVGAPPAAPPPAASHPVTPVAPAR
jgi:hypothetical protein